jgi:hypothetical protein
MAASVIATVAQGEPTWVEEVELCLAAEVSAMDVSASFVRSVAGASN